MLDELLNQVRIHRSCERQLHGDLEHVLAEQRHPSGSIRLVQVSAGRQRRAAIEHPDVVQSQEAALEDVGPCAVLAIHPPREVEQQLLERALQPVEVTRSAPGFLQAVGKDRGPGVHRWIDVAEVPFVGGQLTARVQVLGPHHQVELLFAEVHIDHGQREAVEGEVPRRVPRVFPFVRHRDDVSVVHVMPVLVPRGVLSALIQADAALLEPALDVVVVELLGPEHARECLPHHVGPVGADRGREDTPVEFVRLLPPAGQHGFERASERAIRFPL